MHLPRNPVLLALATALSAALLAGCEGSDDARRDGDTALSVVASTSIVADWAGGVGGERAEVDTVVPAGADVHTFTLAPGDVREIAGADVVFVIGAGLESAFEGTIDANASGPVVELSEGLALEPPAEGFAHEEESDDDHGHGSFDPHIWMDASLAIAAVERIRDELVALDPEGANEYEANAAAYIASIREADTEVAATLDALPRERRVIVTFHDAFGYFARRYGLEILGFLVENPEEEPAAGSLAELVDAIEREGAPYIYVEAQFDASVVRQVANDTGAEVRTIPSDALDDDWPTYPDLLRAIASGIAN